uniref:Putative secreted protein n=1 Tax=Ixodes ricinus TaxID=34613 RepID=A0A6B0V1K6_IXORI
MNVGTDSGVTVAVAFVATPALGAPTPPYPFTQRTEGVLGTGSLDLMQTSLEVGLFISLVLGNSHNVVQLASHFELSVVQLADNGDFFVTKLLLHQLVTVQGTQRLDLDTVDPALLELLAQGEGDVRCLEQRRRLDGPLVAVAFQLHRGLGRLGQLPPRQAHTEFLEEIVEVLAFGELPLAEKTGGHGGGSGWW